ncbi:DUF1772 domain-containing protein [Stella sp.]|uniref:anthrone oxygenase family protein n=1 Tax=Stella sp. TaxID=2912054 RepID=UPI0035B0B1C8
MTAASALLVAASAGSGLVAGIFFAFSTFVLAALDRLPPEDAAAAMRAINVTVLNPLFFAAFFGTGGLALAAAVVHWPDPAVLGAAVCYLAGTIGVTIAGNVPLNERLARGGLDWPGYRRPWGRWNHVRAAAALAAAVLFPL